MPYQSARRIEPNAASAVVPEYGTQQQRATWTAYDRYPAIFAAAAAHAPERPGYRRVLSYGCSTGEEAHTLATRYFPNDFVIGLDVSAPALAAAKARFSDARIIYDESTPETLARYALYDCIFAMSVLCRWPQTCELEDCSPHYTFEEFAASVAALDRYLAPAGILVIYNSNFSVLDTETASRYQVVKGAGIWKNGFVHRFDRTNRRVHGIAADCVYRKMDDGR